MPRLPTVTPMRSAQIGVGEVLSDAGTHISVRVGDRSCIDALTNTCDAREVKANRERRCRTPCHGWGSVRID